MESHRGGPRRPQREQTLSLAPIFPPHHPHSPGALPSAPRARARRGQVLAGRGLAAPPTPGSEETPQHWLLCPARPELISKELLGILLGIGPLGRNHGAFPGAHRAGVEVGT